MEFKQFVGIDVSKDTLDFTLVRAGEKIFYLKTSNSRQGILQFLTQLQHTSATLMSATLFCMEHTGLYNEHLLSTLCEKQAAIWLECAYRIKKSIGLQRGKNDKVDSWRIALYAYEKRDSVRLWIPSRTIIKRLQHFTTLRNQLIKGIKIFTMSLKENKNFLSASLVKELSAHCKSSLKALREDLKKINEKINHIIKEDDYLKHLFELVTSVDGIGPVTATTILVTTNEFQNFETAQQYACYSGVAPFKAESGTSIKGRARVSNLANKSVKALLHMAALSVIHMKGELKDYYDRKVAEGKNKMVVLNAVRNKLVLRVFACIKHNRPYEKIYSPCLV
jgi:transposase